MRSIVFTLLAFLCTLACEGVHAQVADVDKTARKPTSYALVSALGEAFTAISEEETIGSRLKGYKRTSVKAPGDMLNRIALQAMEKIVAQEDVKSKRTYLTLAPSESEKIASLRDGPPLVAELKRQLARIPERDQWDLILVATPAFKQFGQGNMPDKLQGIGIFIAPMLGGSAWLPSMASESEFSRQHRAEVTTPDGSTALSKTYVAPFAYIGVWIFDAKDLTLLGQSLQFNSVALADPNSGSLDVGRSVQKEFLSRKLMSAIEGSLSEAVKQTAIGGRRGVVEVGNIEELARPSKSKPDKPNTEN